MFAWTQRRMEHVSAEIADQAVFGPAENAPFRIEAPVERLSANIKDGVALQHPCVDKPRVNVSCLSCDIVICERLLSKMHTGLLCHWVRLAHWTHRARRARRTPPGGPEEEAPHRVSVCFLLEVCSASCGFFLRCFPPFVVWGVAGFPQCDPKANKVIEGGLIMNTSRSRDCVCQVSDCVFCSAGSKDSNGAQGRVVRAHATWQTLG